VSLGLSARLIMRFGQRAMLFAGLALIAVAFVMLAFARTDGTYLVDFLPATIVMGLGFGAAAPAMMGLGMSAVKPEEAGIASGLFNTTQQVGGAVGLTVLSAFVTARTNNLIDDGRSRAEALTGGYHLAFWLAAGFVLAALVVAAAMLRGEEAESGQVQGGDYAEQPLSASEGEAVRP
jgi:MFS family permease